MLRKSGALAALMALVVAAPAAAQDSDFTGETVTAQSTEATEQTCRDPEVAPLLKDFKDDDLYFVAPGGSFEDGGAGWTLEGGAFVGFGSSAFAPLGAGNRSLVLPIGSAATSPAFCVDERFPHFRVTVGQLGKSEKAKAKIEVAIVYPGLNDPKNGNVRRESDVDADAKHPWQLSKKLKVKSDYGRKTKTGWRLVALRFSVEDAEGGSDARVDDVVVDPRMRY